MLAIVLGVLVTLPIGGADMPVVISVFNALTGLAVAFEGFVLNNSAMIIAGTVVGSSGTLLTQLMAKAMNRSLANVLFSAFGSQVEAERYRARATLADYQATALSLSAEVVRTWARAVEARGQLKLLAQARAASAWRRCSRCCSASCTRSACRSSTPCVR